jgi:hypothetical protein
MEQPAPSIYEVPERFRGWAVVRYSDASCPAFPQVNGKWLVRFDETGSICTSSPLTSNWMRDEYYFMGDKRRRVKLVGASSPGEMRNHLASQCTVGDQPTVVAHAFFVGSAEDFQGAGAAPVPGCKPSWKKSRARSKRAASET